MNRHIEPIAKEPLVGEVEPWTELYRDGKAITKVGAVATLVGVVVKSPYIAGAGLFCVASGGIGRLNCSYKLNKRKD